jgi:hypothetical protein
MRVFGSADLAKIPFDASLSFFKGPRFYGLAHWQQLPFECNSVPISHGGQLCIFAALSGLPSPQRQQPMPSISEIAEPRETNTSFLAMVGLDNHTRQ